MRTLLRNSGGRLIVTKA